MACPGEHNTHSHYCCLLLLSFFKAGLHMVDWILQVSVCTGMLDGVKSLDLRLQSAQSGL